MAHRYFAVKGARINDQDAQKIGARIGILADQGGGEVTRADIVKDACRKRSPLHGYFEWDDSIAAGMYRLKQAGEYLRHIAIVPAEYTEPVRAFHNVAIRPVDAPIRRAYVPLAHVRKDADLMGQVVQAAHRELVSWQARYTLYKELSAASEQVGLAIVTLQTSEGVA